MKDSWEVLSLCLNQTTINVKYVSTVYLRYVADDFHLLWLSTNTDTTTWNADISSHLTLLNTKEKWSLHGHHTAPVLHNVLRCLPGLIAFISSVCSFLSCIQYELLGSLVSLDIKPQSQHCNCFQRHLFTTNYASESLTGAPSWSQYVLIKCSISYCCQATNAIVVGAAENGFGQEWNVWRFKTIVVHSVSSIKYFETWDKCWILDMSHSKEHVKMTQSRWDITSPRPIRASSTNPYDVSALAWPAVWAGGRASCCLTAGNLPSVW